MSRSICVTVETIKNRSDLHNRTTKHEPDFQSLLPNRCYKVYVFAGASGITGCFRTKMFLMLVSMHLFKGWTNPDGKYNGVAVLVSLSK